MDTTPRSQMLRRFLLVTAALAIGTLGWVLMGESESLIAAETAKGDSVARIGDVTITEQEVVQHAAAELLKIERDRHDLIQNATRAEVSERLIAREAKSRGISEEDLMTVEVDSKITDVTDQEIEVFYNQQRAQIRGTLEQTSDRIREFLTGRRRQDAYLAFVAQLEEKYDVEYTIEPFRVHVATDGPDKGAADAPITIVEFSDFECPFCGRVNPTLAQLTATYGDKIRIVFRQFPLDFHPNAQKAAEASLCAHEQGEFWAMHDLMFADQKALDVASLKTKAATIEGLDATEFAQCLDGGEFADEVKADLQAGSEAGVSGTPAFFINGRFLSGAVPYENFAEIIDEELAMKGVAAGEDTASR